MADKNKGGMVLSYVNSMPCVLWLFKTKPYRISSCMAKIVLHLDSRISISNINQKYYTKNEFIFYRFT